MKNNNIILIALMILGLTFTNCSDDDDEIKDSTPPTIKIQSPDLNQIFEINYGTPLTYTQKVSLKAQGIDDKKISKMELIVTNSSGVIVFEKTDLNNGYSETEINISELFSTNNIGIYNVVFKAVDESGNETTTTPRIFEYID